MAADHSETRIKLFVKNDRLSEHRPTWNAGPGAELPIVRLDAQGERELVMARWGLIPRWAKDDRMGYSTFNARAESIDEKPAFRDAFKRRRCIVPMDGFYEWQKQARGKKQPWAISLKDGSPLPVAGLWEIWKSPGGTEILSFTVITTVPNDFMEPIHDRMPVILPQGHWARWLGEEPADPAWLKSILAPCPSDIMEAWKVSDRVGNVRNNSPDLLDPTA